MLGAKLLV